MSEVDAAANNRQLVLVKQKPPQGTTKKIFRSQPLMRVEVTDYKLRDLNFDRNPPVQNEKFWLHPLYQEYFKLYEEILPIFENNIEYQEIPQVIQLFLNEFMGINPLSAEE